MKTTIEILVRLQCSECKRYDRMTLDDFARLTRRWVKLGWPAYPCPYSECGAKKEKKDTLEILTFNADD